MTFFFLVVLVLLIAAIALVATGRFGSLPVATRDKAPTRIPQAPVTAEELGATRFNLGFRGYRMDQVDALLRAVEETLRDRDVAPSSESLSNTGGNEHISGSNEG